EEAASRQKGPFLDLNSRLITLNMDSDIDFDMSSDFEWENAGDQGCFGTSLFEVISVRINVKMEVYGTLRIEDDQGILYFYNKPMDCESVKPNRAVLLLMQPPRVIPADGTITFSIDLKDKYDNEFIKESYTLDLMDNKIGNIFDKYLLARINGKVGSALVYYTIPLVALTSDIEIQLIKGDNGWSHSYVKGRIIAYYGDGYDNSSNYEVKKKHSKFLLYETTSKDNPLQLKDKDMLPLSRSTIVVPARHLLVIKMDLEFQHSDGQSDLLRDFEIQTPTCIYGGHRQQIELNYAALKVAVTYSSDDPYR
ncbi:hypothetical protein KSS87_002726, partial [Heliosperma pusillum]